MRYSPRHQVPGSQLPAAGDQPFIQSAPELDPVFRRDLAHFCDRLSHRILERSVIARVTDRQIRATSTLASNGGQTLLISLLPRDVSLKELQRLSPHGRPTGCQRVKSPITTLARRDQASALEVRQVSRGRGLRNPEHGYEIPNTYFPCSQKVQDP